MKKRRHDLARVGWLFCLLWAGSLGTAEAPPGHSIPPASWDATKTGDPFPSWFGPVLAQPGFNMFTWRAQIRPPVGEAKLALTLVFREPADGFARVIWQGPGRAVTLCSNLFERAASLHQRTLLIEQESLGGPGQLTIESTGSDPVLERVDLTWVEPLVLAAGWTAPSGLYLTPAGKIFPGDELQGAGRHLPMDEEKGLVMDAVLDAGPVKIDAQNPVRFVAPIAGKPAYGRIEAQVAGLSLGQEPSVWVNGQAMGGLSVEVPGLDDPGYRENLRSREVGYGGWRKVVVYVPAGLLRQGENQVDWRETGSPTTVRNLRLQVVFAVTQPPAPSVARTVTANPAAVSLPSPASSSWVGGGGSAGPKLRTGLSSGSGVVGLRTE
ncbi:MAG: hypothetical protein ACEQSM_03510 [Aliarcobacter sp.]